MYLSWLIYLGPQIFLVYEFVHQSLNAVTMLFFPEHD